MAVFKKAPGVDEAASNAGAGFDLSALDAVNQIATTYWPAVLGITLVTALVAFGRRDASVIAAGVAAVLQATLTLSTQ